MTIEGRAYPVDIHYLQRLEMLYFGFPNTDQLTHSSPFTPFHPPLFPSLLLPHRPVANYLTATTETVLSVHREGKPGDVLAFLTGQEEVEKTVAELREHASRATKGMQLLVLPLYGSLPYFEQLKVFQRTPPNTRKVVIATNIAETSVTINGIVYVIDCGFVKLKAFSPKTALGKSHVSRVSQLALMHHQCYTLNL